MVKNSDIASLLAELQLKPAGGDELTLGVATRLVETMRKVDELATRLNAISAPPQPRGLFDRFRMVMKGQ